MRPIQDFAVTRSSSSFCSISSTRTAVNCAVLWLASSRMASPPRILPELEHLPAHGPNHFLQPELVCVGVIALSAGELAQADRHHFEQAALDLPREVRVPFHAVDEHDTVGVIGGLVHECLDAISRASKGNDFELADDRASHLALINAVMGENVGLTLRRRRSVAAHGREDERLRLLGSSNNRQSPSRWRRCSGFLCCRRQSQPERLVSVSARSARLRAVFEPRQEHL